jgi:hypothetical protein
MIIVEICHDTPSPIVPTTKEFSEGGQSGICISVSSSYDKQQQAWAHDGSDKERPVTKETCHPQPPESHFLVS